MLPCGHTMRNVACHQATAPAEIYCTHKIEYAMAGCGHLLKIACGEIAKFSGETGCKECFETCGGALTCGHSCSAKCGNCRMKENEETATEEPQDTEQLGNDAKYIVKHMVCKSKCAREFICGHSCTEDCHAGVGCKPCVKRCPVRCAHSSCPSACHNVCAPCIEKCEWTCEHEGRCPEPCGAPCTRKVCDKRCDKMLPCGHQCPSVCGEKCPSPQVACKACACPNALSHVVDLFLFSTLAEYDIDETGPLVALECGHVYSMQSLDGLMELKEHYTCDMTGKWGAAKEQGRAIKKMISCPDCRTPVLGVYRYGRSINKGVLDSMTCKFQVAGERKLNVLRDKLQCVPHTQVLQHKSCTRDLKEIEAELTTLKNTKHPLQKIYEAAHAQASRTSAPFCSDISRPDPSVHAGSRLLLIKAKLTQFSMDKNCKMKLAAAKTDWKKHVLKLNGFLEIEVKSLITYMSANHMLSSHRDTLCVAVPGIHLRW